MKREEAVLGMRVSASDRLDRQTVWEREKRAYRKSWVPSAERYEGFRADPNPVEGVLVGLRSVPPSGLSQWRGEDEGQTWMADTPRRTMALVAVDLRHKIARVWLDDLTAVVS